MLFLIFRRLNSNLLILSQRLTTPDCPPNTRRKVSMFRAYKMVMFVYISTLLIIIILDFLFLTYYQWVVTLLQELANAFLYIMIGCVFKKLLSCWWGGGGRFNSALLTISFASRYVSRELQMGVPTSSRKYLLHTHAHARCTNQHQHHSRPRQGAGIEESQEWR